MPKDSPGQIAKLQLNTMGYSGQATPQLRTDWLLLHSPHKTCVGGHDDYNATLPCQ